jgi:hypothetical protein
MALTQATIDRLVNGFKVDLERAQVLYGRIALAGATIDQNGAYLALRQPDRRDAAQFIFFEAAAQFELFCLEAFKIEVRSKFDIQPQRAVYVMGGTDRGLAGFMGWASPRLLQDRARALFGKVGFFAHLERRLGTPTYQRLTHAHKVRNRIAHTSGSASPDFNAILAQLNVPVGSRQGLSVGRLLMDYPTSQLADDRWFYRFINAYEELATKFESFIS